MKNQNSLTEREAEVIQLLLQGKSNKMIALKLGISISTVEYHLTNIYSKVNVGSKFELILKLAHESGNKLLNLGESPDDKLENISNNDLVERMEVEKMKSKKEVINKMQNKVKFKNIPLKSNITTGIVVSLIAGFCVLLIMMRFGHMLFSSVKPWIIPLTIILTGLGAYLGWLNHKRSNSLWKLSLNTFFSVFMGAALMIPIVGFIVYPLAKLVEQIGLFQREWISNDTASTLMIASMLVAWLAAGAAAGNLGFRVLSKKDCITVS